MTAGRSSASAAGRSFVEAAEAARAALERARQARSQGSLKPRDLNVLFALVELVPLYSRLTDTVGVRQIAALARGVEREELDGWKLDAAGASLRSLAAAGVIRYEPGKGRSSRARVTFPKASAPELDFEAEASAPEQQSQRGGARKPARQPGHSGESSGDSPGESNSARSGRSLEAPANETADVVPELNRDTLRRYFAQHRHPKVKLPDEPDALWTDFAGSYLSDEDLDGEELDEACRSMQAIEAAWIDAHAEGWTVPSDMRKRADLYRFGPKCATCDGILVNGGCVDHDCSTSE